MNKKIIPIITYIIIFTNLVSATSVLTEYSGSGDLEIGTVITSNVEPTIQDNIESHTACDDECCVNDCFDDEEGEYYGWSYLDNEHSGLSIDYGEVDGGCINLEQDIVEYKNQEDQTITTKYRTGINGTGYAYSWVSGVPFFNYGYQYAEGSGKTWAYFGQKSEIGNEFDYETIYGGGTVNCEMGYVEMENEYDMNFPVIYNPLLLEMYCESGYSYGTLYGKSTDKLNTNVSVEHENLNWFLETDVEGEGILNINVDAEETMSFGFDMVLE